MVANEYANLESTDPKGSALDEGKTKIEVTNYGSGEEQNTFNDGTYASSSGADVLGKSVTLYVKNDSSKTSKATVLGGAILDDDNKVVTNAGQKALGKLASDNDLDLVNGAEVIENFHSAGKWKDYTDASNAAARSVSKTLIDNNDDGDVDYVLVNKQYFGQVSKYSTKEDGSITVNTSGKADPALTADDKDDVVGFEDVKKDDYVLASWIGGKLHVEKAESVTGTIEAYKADKGVTSSLTVGDSKYATNNTVFFYVDLDGSEVNDVDVYTGYKNAPSIDKASGLKGTVVLDSSASKNVNVLALVGDDVKTTSDDVKNHLYITDIGSDHKDGYPLVDAIFAGTDEEKTDVKVDTADLNGKGLYLYTEGKDGVYSLDPVGSNELAVNGPVANISDSTINYNGKEYDLTDKTVLIDLTDDVVAYTGTLPTTTDYIVSMLVDDTDDGDLLMIVIDNSNSALLDPSDKDIKDAFKSEDTVYAAGKLPSSVEVPEKKTLVLDGTVTGTTTISGDGTVKLADTTVKGSVKSAGKVELSGTTTVEGTLDLEGATVTGKGAVVEIAEGANLKYRSIERKNIVDGAFALKLNDKGGVDFVFEGKIALKSSVTLTIASKDTLVLGAKAVLTIPSDGDVKGDGTVTVADGAQIVSKKESALTHNSLTSVNAKGTWTYSEKTWSKGE